MGDSSTESLGKKNLKKSTRYAEDATRVSKESRDRIEGSDLFSMILGLAEGAAQDPFTANPDALKANFASNANAVADRTLQEGLAQLALGPGVRSGASIDLGRTVASDLGERIATGFRDIDIQSAMQRIDDVIKAIQIASMPLGLMQGLDQSVINAHLASSQALGGTGGAQVQLGQQEGSGIGSILSGILGLGGTVLGNYGDIFGGGSSSSSLGRSSAIGGVLGGLG